MQDLCTNFGGREGEEHEVIESKLSSPCIFPKYYWFQPGARSMWILPKEHNETAKRTPTSV